MVSSSKNALRKKWWEKAHEAYWSLSEEPIESPKRIAALLSSVIDSGLLDPSYLRPFINRHLMPDIAMCTGDDCPVKENCWRFLAPPDRYQSQFAAPPHTEEGCEYFWDINED